jgi:hypothetical protein
MICTGTNTEANIRKVLEFASKVISKYVISLNNPEDEKRMKAEADKKKKAQAAN